MNFSYPSQTMLFSNVLKCLSKQDLSIAFLILILKHILLNLDKFYYVENILQVFNITKNPFV